MNINLLNNLSERIFVDRCQRSFEQVLVGINNIIDSAAYLTHEKYDDKFLNQVEDIKQEILFKIWLDLTATYRKFDDRVDLAKYVLGIAEEVLNETRG